FVESAELDFRTSSLQTAPLLPTTASCFLAHQLMPEEPFEIERFSKRIIIDYQNAGARLHLVTFQLR
ncbi:hypothetical protein, partial [Plebeiibacterium sediminum]